MELVKLDNDGIRIQVLEALTVIISVRTHPLGKGHTHWVRDTPTGLHPYSYLLTPPSCVQVAKEAVGQESRHIVELCTQLFVKCCHGNEPIAVT